MTAMWLHIVSRIFISYFFRMFIYWETLFYPPTTFFQTLSQSRSRIIKSKSDYYLEVITFFMKDLPCFGTKSLSAHKTWLLTKFNYMPGFSGSSLPHKVWGMITTEPTDNYTLRFFSINKNDAETNVRLEIKSLNMLSRINCLRQIKKESCFRRQSEIPKANSKRRKQIWSTDLQR